MTPEQNEVKQWMKAFGQETPEKPVVPNLETRKLRAKLILEEALETINALGFYVGGDGRIKHNDENYPIDLKEIADGCEDLKVVVEGTLVACGLVQKNDFVDLDKGESDEMIEIPNTDEMFHEVMRSNWSKFWTLDEVRKFNSEFPANQNTFVQIGIEGRLFCKDKDGKVIKSPSYSQANLQSIIEEMAR